MPSRLASLIAVADSKPGSVAKSSVSGINHIEAICGPSGPVTVPDTREVATRRNCMSSPDRSSPDAIVVTPALAALAAAG